MMDMEYLNIVIESRIVWLMIIKIVNENFKFYVGI